MDEVKVFKFRLKRSDNPELYEHLISLPDGKRAPFVRAVLSLRYEKAALIREVERLLNDKISQQLSDYQKSSAGIFQRDFVEEIFRRFSAIEHHLHELEREVSLLNSGDIKEKSTGKDKEQPGLLAPGQLSKMQRSIKRFRSALGEDEEDD